jgi:hypothetical protein
VLIVIVIAQFAHKGKHAVLYLVFICGYDKEQPDTYRHNFISPSLLLDSISFMGRSMFFRSRIAS